MATKKKPTPRKRGVVSAPPPAVAAAMRAAQDGEGEDVDTRSDAQIVRDAEKEAERRKVEAALNSAPEGSDLAGPEENETRASGADGPSEPQPDPEEPLLVLPASLETLPGETGLPTPGRVVMFHSTVRRAGLRSHDPQPAMVTAVRDGKLSLTVFGEGSTRFVTKIDADRSKAEYWSWPKRG